MPEGPGCVKAKQNADNKRNGIYKERMAACGYSQILGVDFVESYAPVINNITWKVPLAAKSMRNHSTKVLNFRTTFLHRAFEREIYLK